MKTNLWLLALMVLAAGIAGAGCGGGDGGGETIARADFISQGNEVCSAAVKDQEESLERLRQEVKEGKLASDGSEGEVALVEAVAASINSMVGEFEDIGAPVGEEESFTKMLEEYQEAADRAEARPEGFFATDGFAKPNERAQKLELTDCEGL